MKGLLRRFVFSVLMISFIAGITNASDLTSGLVGHWLLDGNADDVVGKAKGELVGGAEWSDEGRVKGAVKLDGSTGYVKISGFEPLTTDTLTTIAWIKGWRQSAWCGIVVSRGPTPFWMGFTDQDTLSYVWNNDSAQTWGWRKGPKIPQDEWAMVAITIEPDKATAYVYTDSEGLKKGTNEIKHIEQTVADNLKFGWDECCGPQRHFQGLIDEVMIYDRALSEDEILKLAAGGLAVGPVGKLTTIWGGIKRQSTR
jgi:hypothetical protein